MQGITTLKHLLENEYCIVNNRIKTTNSNAGFVFIEILLGQETYYYLSDTYYKILCIDTFEEK